MTTQTRKPAPTPERQTHPVQKRNSSATKTLPAVQVFQPPLSPIQKKKNTTGMPDNLKTGIEDLSGISMDDVKVHYNSDKPAQLNALAYAQGNNIHVAAGQEKHLPHEAWHVVQQKQGRVNATMQMKGIAINDDSALEREADVMGGKAIQMVSKPGTRNSGTGTEEQKARNTATAAVDNVLFQRKAVNNNAAAPLQMKVTATTFAGLLAEQKALARQIESTNTGTGAKVDYDKKIMPQFNKAKLIEHVKQAKAPLRGSDQMIYTLGKYNEEKLHLTADDVFTEDKWAGYLQWLNEQHEAQANKKHVTAGFEFEFSTMAEHNPFQGVTHVELAESTEEINGKHFILETDASNALELVTPPFWLEAISNEIPLPLHKDVKNIDNMIKARLNEMLTDGTNIETLVAAFKTNPGLTFTIKDAKVAAKNLSDRSIDGGIGRYTKDDNNVPADTINKIEIGKITKFGSGGINTQVNIATDAATYMALAQLNLPNKETNKYLQQFYDLQRHLEKSIRASEYDMPLSGFLQLFVRNIAGQLAVPSMAFIQKMQEKAFKKEQFTRDRTDMDPIYHLMTSSVVKDVGKVWIKDNLINIGAGILKPEDWQTVLRITQGKEIMNAIETYQVPEYLSNDVSDKVDEKFQDQVIKENKHKVEAYYAHAKGLMKTAVTNLTAAINGLKLAITRNDKPIGTPETDFMRHDPKYITPRQDTHVPPNKVNFPTWQKRLHVTEIRSEPAETLKRWNKQIKLNKEKEEERLNLPPWQHLNEFIKLNLPPKYFKTLGILKPMALQYNVTSGEIGTFMIRIVKMMQQDQLDKCIKLADPIAFDKNKSIAQIIATDPQFSEFD